MVTTKHTQFFTKREILFEGTNPRELAAFVADYGYAYPASRLIYHLHDDLVARRWRSLMEVPS